MPEVSIDEMEDLAKEEEASKSSTSLNSIKLDDSSVPEHLKGKTAADLVEMIERTRESLRISEDARTALSASAHRVSDPREEHREVEPEDEADTITREQLAELFKEDPMKAMEIYDRRMQKSLVAHLDGRFKPLISGSIGQQENAAKGRYASEFELFADQISKVASEVDPSILTTAKGWDDVIAYVRGQPQNFTKLLEKAAGATRRTASEARREQVEDAGFANTRGARQEAAEVDFQGLDETQRKIAENQFPQMTPSKAYAEYKKWM